MESWDLEWEWAKFTLGHYCDSCDIFVNSCFIYTGIDDERARVIALVLCDTCYEGEEHDAK